MKNPATAPVHTKTQKKPQGLPDEVINAVNENGMSELHIAVGNNDLKKARLLVRLGARFFPDNHGRMPSHIAALMEVSDEMQDFVAEQEEKAEVNEG